MYKHVYIISQELVMETVIKDMGNEIIIKPKKKNKLSEMLDAINEHNIHEEIETNVPVGKEIWGKSVSDTNATSDVGFTTK
jgi:hypothetical protein